MTKLYSQISGWGKYTPERILTNKELEKTINEGLKRLMATPYWAELKAKHIKDKK